MTDSRTRVYGRSPSSFEVKCPVPPIPGSWPSALILTAATSGAQKWLILRSRVEKIAFPAQNVAFLHSRAPNPAFPVQNVAFLHSRIAPFGTDDTVHTRFLCPEKSAPGAQLRQIIRILQTERGQVRLAVTGAASSGEVL